MIGTAAVRRTVIRMHCVAEFATQAMSFWFEPRVNQLP